MNARGDRQGGTPRRRVPGRRTRAVETRTDTERIAAVAAEHDRPVEDVLREVADFRLALETDMIIAAAAVDADNPEILSEVLDGERRELATFHDRLLERLAEAAAEDDLSTRRAARERRPRRVGRAARAMAVAAAAVAVFGAGRGVMTPDMRATANAAAMETADQHYADFSSAVTSDSPVAVREAAQQLHRTLQQLITEHANDPDVAQRAAQLLQAEINLLSATDPHGASQVLAQARSLVSMLEREASPKVRRVVQPVLDAAAPPAPTPPKPSASAKPKATPSPKPKPTSTPKSSSSPSGSSSPAPNPLDTP